MTRTRSHLIVTSAQVRTGRLRPSQGGALHPPVGPVGVDTDDTVTDGDSRARMNDADPRWDRVVNLSQPGIDWSDAVPARGFFVKGDPDDLLRGLQRALDRANEYRQRAGIPPVPAAPPVDAELEAERVRLVGKRVRWTEDSGLPDMMGPDVVIEVARLTPHAAIVARFADATRAQASLVEPIPKEPRTIHDAKVVTFADLAIGEWFCFHDCAAARRKLEPKAWTLDGCRFDACASDLTDRVVRLAPPGGGA